MDLIEGLANILGAIIRCYVCKLFGCKKEYQRSPTTEEWFDTLIGFVVILPFAFIVVRIIQFFIAA